MSDPVLVEQDGHVETWTLKALRLMPDLTSENEELTALRMDVRGFLGEQVAAGTFTPSADTWLTRWDEAFTRSLAERGWLGLTIPREYGGQGKTFLHRFVVTEELLAAGAPVAAHWIADRQIAPTLLRFGTEQQKRAFLPRIARGECFFGIGMSEPDSGSDLASVRTRATRVAGGWRVNGTKVWTSGAHRAEAFFVLARTSPLDPDDRHGGLSQLVVDLRGEGVEVRPITSMGGAHHFNEVVLDDVFVRDDMVLGEVGAGWTQVSSELGFERSGPERILSTFVVFAEMLAAMQAGRIPGHGATGRQLGRLIGLHHMSLAVSGALERGEPADTAAALVKLLGTTLEGDLVELADTHSGDAAPDEESSRLAALVHAGLVQRPGFTLRGGTNEILRGVVARHLGVR